MSSFYSGYYSNYHCYHIMSAGGSLAKDNLIDQLRQLMAWRDDGLLSDAQFENAKAALGL